DSFLHEQGITDLQDIVRYVPNVRVDTFGTYIQPRIRGFSTNTVVNRGLELPVGIVIDEVPYSRGDYFATGLFDLERVEVLRGPQGQLFGANTAVGLLSLVTKNPTDEYTGFIDGELGELDSRRFEAGVGGPVLPGWLNFRLAGLWDERDGFVRNTTKEVVSQADGVFGGRLRRSVRAKLELPDVYGATFLVSYQRDYLDIGPTQRELTFVPERFRDLMRQYDPNVDFEPDNLVGSLDGASFRRADLDTVAAKASYELGGFGLDLVGGWTRLESFTSDDSDSAPWPATFAVVDEASDQTTVELRVSSPDLPGFFGVANLFGALLPGPTDFTTGVFFQRRTQRPTDSRITVEAPLFLVLTAMSMGVPFPPVRPPSREEFFTTHFEQTAEELSAFGQMNWRFLERWTLLYGMRLDWTSKEASWIQEVGPETAVVLPQFIDSFTDALSRDEFNFAPKAGVKFDWTDEVNLYGTWSRNFQAGGFNNFSSSDQRATRIVEPAKVESWEAGTKTRLLGGTAEVNVGLFWMTMKNFQLFTLGATPGESFPVSHVVNVGELRARGVELDSIWLPTEWLTLRGALGLNDNEYLEFPIGTC
ncbi:MAG: TonB-dependent receptor, partial [Candidatus Binatia bacterium]